MAFTYHNFTICYGYCIQHVSDLGILNHIDRNPMINQLASILGPAGIWLWLPIEFTFLFGNAVFCLLGMRSLWQRMDPK
jgi:hypothetical protein